MATEVSDISASHELPQKEALLSALHQTALEGGDPYAFLASQHLPMPHHVVLIPDGNGRWAQDRGLPVMEGHNTGADAIEGFIRGVAAIPDIKEVTVWALSVDNIEKRSPEEVGNLMTLMGKFIERLLPEWKEKGDKFIHIGDITGLPPSLQERILTAQQQTQQNSNRTIRIGINYQGFQEELSLIHAAIDTYVKTGRRPSSREDITALKVQSQIPPADFVIRTSGEQRLSGLGPVGDTAELGFPSTYLPAMRPVDFASALAEFGFRDRRYGGRKMRGR